MKILMLSAVPVLALLAGCGPQASTNTDTVRARETNSALVTPATNAASVSSSTNTDATAADNTAKNVRDRQFNTVTPGDQGESQADRELTQKIRKTLVTGPGDYSVTAKNVKIVTVNGKVTLRGPVNTAAEKTAIATLARSVAGDANVEDQLEVKSNP